MLKKKEREKKHGRKIASRAEAIWGWATVAGQVRARRRTELLIASASITKGHKVLEIGAGTGVFTQKIAETGAHITAIDISYELLEKAKRKVQYVNFCVADVENMPFRASMFDAVIGSSILHHLDIIPALREINRVLKDCGRISLAEPNMMNPQIMLQKNILLLKKFLGDSPDETAFFRWRLSQLLRREGFSEINIMPFDFLHPMTPTSLIGLVNRTGMFLEKTPLLKEISGSLIISAVKLI